MSGAYLWPLGLRWEEVNTAKGSQLQNAAQLEALVQKAMPQDKRRICVLDRAGYDNIKNSGGALPDTPNCHIKVGNRIFQPYAGPDVSNLKPDDLALSVSTGFPGEREGGRGGSSISPRHVRASVSSCVVSMRACRVPV